MTANANVHSHMIRELAQAIGKAEGEILSVETAEQVKAYLEMLADIHEDLSDFEFDSDSFDRMNEIFRTHGLDLFEMDSSLDEDSLKAKYAGDDSERKHAPGEHPAWTRTEWVGAVAKSETDRGYWEWVRVQIEDNE